ncbi:hypothetical protein [Thiolapillus sp.]|uniref:hypothetical protein n=1 Tax=Thiolapillus sp. TaxID=2017437 RepID=UPI003AF5BAF8
MTPETMRYTETLTNQQETDMLETIKKDFETAEQFAEAVIEAAPMVTVLEDLYTLLLTVGDLAEHERTDPALLAVIHAAEKLIYDLKK